jgi:hypothetical protein
MFRLIPKILNTVNVVLPKFLAVGKLLFMPFEKFTDGIILYFEINILVISKSHFPILFYACDLVGYGTGFSFGFDSELCFNQITHFKM